MHLSLSVPRGIRDMEKRKKPQSAAERQRQSRRRRADAKVAVAARAQVWAIIQAQLTEPGSHPELWELARRMSSQFPGEMSIPENMIETGAVTPPSLDNQNTESASIPNPATPESPFTVTRSVKPATGKPVWVVTPKLYPSQAEKSAMTFIAQELRGLWKTSDCGQIPGFHFITEADAHLFMSNSSHIASRRFRL